MSLDAEVQGEHPAEEGFVYTGVISFIGLLRWVAWAFAVLGALAIVAIAWDASRPCPSNQYCDPRAANIVWVTLVGMSTFFFTLLLFAIAYALELLGIGAGVIPIEPRDETP